MLVQGAKGTIGLKMTCFLFRASSYGENTTFQVYFATSFLNRGLNGEDWLHTLRIWGPFSNIVQISLDIRLEKKQMGFCSVGLGFHLADVDSFPATLG